MASVVLLAVFLLSGSFPARAQDTRTDQAGSVLREYVDRGYCTYTYVVPPGSRTEGCTPPGLERQLAETEEETGRLKNQVDRLSSLVEILISRMNNLSAELKEEKGRSAQLEQNLTQELQEQETRLQTKCTCERLVPDGVISTTAATLTSEPETGATMMSPTEPLSNTPCAKSTEAAEITTTNQPTPGAGTATGIQVRLVSVSTPIEGRVEVRNGTGRWGSVCDDNFDLQDADVVCRQLGFGAALEVKLAGHFGEGSGNVWLDEVACRGNETDLGDCPADSWGRSDCSHKEDAGVVCADKSAIRLFGGHVPWEGRLEVRPGEKSEWGVVCNTGWTEAAAGVVCRQMGYTGGMTSSGLPGVGEGRGQIWLGDVTCSGDETNILSCGFIWKPSDCDPSQDVQIICTGAVSARLVGGQNASEGRVEVRPGNGDWGTVCDDGFDDRDAQVVCRQLGYRNGVARVGGVFPDGTANIWLDNLNCTGNESSVGDCEINRWGDHDCTHKEDAGVVCSNAAEKDCAEYHSSGVTTSGVYPIGLRLPDDVEAYCDMDTAGGGWTVIQRRQDGSVPFNRTWEEYKLGFGNKNGEYWLGNENIHLLTSQKNYSLRVDIMDWTGATAFALYSTFRVSGESDQYRLHISGYSGTAGDYMNNGQRFSTVDRDNDILSGVHCSQRFGQGGWWFINCRTSALNGGYLGNCGRSCPLGQGLVWFPWTGNTYSLKSVSMKIRP
ncbi:scavenger receptor cysteine-rich domain-containing protein DMBT1-like [Branchiostoma floridae x Branchiostoma japonicum]